MSAIIDDRRREVQSAFEAAFAIANSDDKQPLFAVEAELWTLLLALGRALTRLYLAHQVARPRKAEYGAGGRRFRLTGKQRVSQLGTRFGKVAFERPVGEPLDRTSEKVDLPIDRELGLCSGFS